MVPHVPLQVPMDAPEGPPVLPVRPLTGASLTGVCPQSQVQAIYAMYIFLTAAFFLTEEIDKII